MVGNLAQANVMVKADAKMAFASVTHSSVVTIAHKVSYYVALGPVKPKKNCSDFARNWTR